MKITITGHTNIEKIHGYPVPENGYNNDALAKTYNEILEGLKKFCETSSINFSDLTLVSGMARGVDEVFALIAMKHNLELILAIPGSINWHQNRGTSRGIRAQAVFYNEILMYKKISSIIEVKKTYNGLNFQFVNIARNQFMVDTSDYVFSYKAYDSTGTDDCITRAKKKGNYTGNFRVKEDNW